VERDAGWRDEQEMVSGRMAKGTRETRGKGWEGGREGGERERESVSVKG